jgi:uracil-DNA glycosylase
MLAALRAWAPHDWPVAPDWRGVVDQFVASSQGQQLATLLQQRLDAGAVIYPPQPFRALELTALADVKVVILGQDPYHGVGQAQGLAFSVAPGVAVPPSMRNILKELSRDPLLRVSGVGFQGSLAGWARQGVLLLNTCLTVESGRPASHAPLGWDGLTNAVIRAILRRRQDVVFMLWGAHAQAREALIQTEDLSHKPRALMLKANHPSPRSALRAPMPFLGCGHFSIANQYLQAHGHPPICWAEFNGF